MRPSRETAMWQITRGRAGGDGIDRSFAGGWDGEALLPKRYCDAKWTRACHPKRAQRVKGSARHYWRPKRRITDDADLNDRTGRIAPWWRQRSLRQAIKDLDVVEGEALSIAAGTKNEGSKGSGRMKRMHDQLLFWGCATSVSRGVPAKIVCRCP